jgi:3-polyprenyl-4-hydroxybenzoate decarboxylase
MVDLIVARALDVFGVKINTELIRRWGTGDK